MTSELIKRLSFIEQLAKSKAPALSDGVRSLTYAELTKQITKLADWLLKQKADKQNMVVALHAQNSIDWVLVDLACQAANFICLPLPDFFSKEQIEHCLSQARADLLFTDKIGARDTTTLESPIHLAAYSFAAKKKQNNYVRSTPEGTQKITFTSGSTGAPKGVCLSAKHQWDTAESLANVIDIKHSKHLCLLPLATLLENVAGIYAPLLSAGQVILPSDEERGLSGSSGLILPVLLSCINQHQPDTIILLPQLLSALVGACQQGWQAPDSLQFIAVGGARVASELISSARAFGLPVYEGYGLSECGSVVALNTKENDQLGSAGKILPHCKVSIENEQIQVSGSTFLGYLGQPESWYPSYVETGDLGQLLSGKLAGELNNEYLQIQGRQKNVIISSFGRNISPEWIESELMARPLFTQCVVIGETQPFLACLLSAPEKVRDEHINDWINHVNQKLPDYAQIKAWQRLDTKAWAGLLTANGRPRREHVTQELADIIARLFLNKEQSTVQAKVSVLNTNSTQELTT